MWIRESMARKVVWVEDSMGSWMVRAREMESRRSLRAQALDLFPPVQVEHSLAVSPCSLLHWWQFQGRLAGQASCGMDSHLRAAEEMVPSWQEWLSRALPLTTECGSPLEQEKVASSSLYNQGI